MQNAVALSYTEVFSPVSKQVVIPTDCANDFEVKFGRTAEKIPINFDGLVRVAEYHFPKTLYIPILAAQYESETYQRLPADRQA
jgi:hypothetical protein